MSRQINVKVVTDVDASQLDDLQDKLSETYSVNVDANDLDEAQIKAEEVGDEIEDDHTLAVDSTELDDVEGRVEDVADAIETDHKLSVDTSDLDDAQAKIDETSSSLDGLISVAAGIGLSAGVEQMVTTADNINTSWNRLKLTFGETGVSMDTLKAKQTELNSATGRSGATIRGYFNQMGIAGVSNTDLLASSFKALSGKAYQTGNDIGTMETKLQTMVLSGNAGSRMLKGLGLSAESLAQVMGVSADEISDAFKDLTPEERLQAITQAMGDGAEANEMYKNSYAGLKDQADAAMAGLMGAIGSAILPYVIPALETVTNVVNALSDGFKALPAPVQGAIGGLIAISTVTLSTILTLTGIIKTINTIKKTLEESKIVESINKITSAAKNAATSLINLGKNAALTLKEALIGVGTKAKDAALSIATLGKEALLAGANALKSAAMWVVEKTVLIAHKIASYASAAAQWALNIAMDANPIMLVVLAVTALIAVLGYLYFNNETVRQSIDWLAQSLMYIGQVIYGFVTGAIQWLSDLFSQFTAQLGLNKDDWIQSIIAFIVFLPNLPMQVAISLLDALARALGFGDSFKDALIRAAKAGVDGFKQAIEGIPKAISDCLNWAKSLIENHPIVQTMKWLGDQMSNAFSYLGLGQRSPGKIYKAIRNELNWSDELISESSLPKTASDLGSRITDRFKPKLNYQTGNIETMNGQVTTKDSSNGMPTIINLSFEGCMFDKEERVQEIKDVINKEVNWNNITAGRSV